MLLFSERSALLLVKSWLCHCYLVNGSNIVAPFVPSFSTLRVDTMTSADFSWFSYLSLNRFFCQGTRRSPRVSSSTFSSYICHIYYYLIWGYFGLYLVLQTHPKIATSNVIRVPQTEDLSRASFRFHVTMDTLAFD